MFLFRFNHGNWLYDGVNSFNDSGSNEGGASDGANVNVNGNIDNGDDEGGGGNENEVCCSAIRSLLFQSSNDNANMSGTNISESSEDNGSASAGADFDGWLYNCFNSFDNNDNGLQPLSSFMRQACWSSFFRSFDDNNDDDSNNESGANTGADGCGNNNGSGRGGQIKVVVVVVLLLSFRMFDTNNWVGTNVDTNGDI